MLHRPRLLARMALPPTHQNFPHPSLLHAICACASLWCAPAVYSQSAMTNHIPLLFSMPNSEKFAKFSMTPQAPTFSSVQADLAKASINEGLNTGHKLFDIVRAMVCLPCHQVTLLPLLLIDRSSSVGCLSMRLGCWNAGLFQAWQRG
jgi:hypothetical protein